jgi:hypothetical protein
MELQINPVLISCIRMSWEVQVPFLSEMSFEMFRCLVCRRLVFFRLAGPLHGFGSIFGGLFKAAMPLLKKGTQTLERKALKTRLNIAGDVVQGINIKQAATSRLKSTGENLFQKAMDTVGSPGQRVLKGPAKRKKIVVIHDLCFNKRVSISQDDVVFPRPTDGKFDVNPFCSQYP